MELCQRIKAHVFDADRARLRKLQGVDIDLDEFGRARLSLERGACDEPGGNGLGVGLHRLGQRDGHEHALIAEYLLDPGAQCGPVFLGKIEMTTQVEKSDLAHATSLAA